MRSFLAVLLFLGVFSVQTSAQANEPCKNLDLEDAAAIKACLESDTTWYEARTKPMFEPNKECSFLQMQVVKMQMTAIDPQKGKRVNSKTLDDASIPRPSCETISAVVELIRGRPSAWTQCMGYEEASDKFEHFKVCIVEYTKGRYGMADNQAAAASLSGMDCKRANATYAKTFEYIYPPIQQEGPFYGRKLPPSYQDPDCEKVDAFIANIKEEVEQLRAVQYAQAQAYKAEQKRIKEEKAKERLEKAKKTQEMFRKMEEADQRSFEKLEAQILDGVKSREEPTDSIENKHLRFALVKQIWVQMPEESKEIGFVKAKLLHTTHGFKTWSNTPMMPNLYHAIKSVKIKECDVKKGKAHCTYDVTVSSSVHYKDHNNQERADVYGQLASALVGPRSYSWESDLVHDGRQWMIKLTNKQKKLILPPEIDMGDRQSENEKIQCDTMSAMGIPMLC
jgi:hypothetical protein